jgi:hypothetical protein
MKPLVALSIAVGVLAGIATWASLTFGWLVWALFIAYASFFHCGGDANALKNSAVNNVFGAFLAWVAAMILVNVPIAGLGTAWPAIIVCITAATLVLAAHVKALSVIPAGFYGYASTFAYLLMAKDAMTAAALTKFNLQNAFVAVALAMVIGNVFGFLTAKMSAALQASSGKAASAAA